MDFLAVVASGAHRVGKRLMQIEAMSLVGFIFLRIGIAVVHCRIPHLLSSISSLPSLHRVAIIDLEEFPGRRFNRLRATGGWCCPRTGSFTQCARDQSTHKVRYLIYSLLCAESRAGQPCLETTA